MNEIIREGMVFYRSFYDAIKGLPAEDFKRCAIALLEYGLDGKEPEGNGIERTVFIMAKPQIDKNNQRYINGKQGGRTKNQTETKTEPNRNQTETKVEPKEKDKVKEKDKDKDIKDICSELKAPEPAKNEEIILTLPLNDKSEYQISAGAVQEWAELYPAVDVMQQLRNMRGWLMANPERRKTKKGIMRFVTAWLSREQNNGNRVSTTPAVKKKEFNYEQRTWDFEELERIKRAEMIKYVEEENDRNN